MSVDSAPAATPSRGTRTRAGNAMGRTRAAVLEGAVRAIEKHGTRRTTMADIASLAGVAKATLYNHFRTKTDVYAAVLDTTLRELAVESLALARVDLAEALSAAAERLSTNPALRRIAADEPAVLAGLVRDDGSAVWLAARAAVADVLRAAGRLADEAHTGVVTRWLTTHIATPATSAELRAGSQVLAAGLPRAPAPEGAERGTPG
jgi:AcrR family transcriptional regulator